MTTPSEKPPEVPLESVRCLKYLTSIAVQEGVQVFLSTVRDDETGKYLHDASAGPVFGVPNTYYFDCQNEGCEARVALGREGDKISVDGPKGSEQAQADLDSSCIKS